MTELEERATAINNKAGDLQVVFHRWQRASMNAARERNMQMMIGMAVEIREMVSQYPGRAYPALHFQGQNLVLRLKGEMNLYNIIETIVMLGLYDNETFRAECRHYLMEKAVPK